MLKNVLSTKNERRTIGKNKEASLKQLLFIIQPQEKSRINVYAIAKELL